MNCDHNFQSNLLNDIVSRRFSDAEDLVHLFKLELENMTAVESPYIGQAEST